MEGLRELNKYVPIVHFRRFVVKYTLPDLEQKSTLLVRFCRLLLKYSLSKLKKMNTSRSFLEVAAQVWTPRAQIIQHLSFIFVGYCEGIQYQKSKQRAPLVYFRRLLSLITANMSTPLVHFRRLLLKRKL